MTDCLATMTSRNRPGHEHTCHLASHDPRLGHVCKACGAWFWPKRKES